MPVLRKEDLNDYALRLGVWDSICDLMLDGQKNDLAAVNILKITVEEYLPPKKLKEN